MPERNMPELKNDPLFIAHLQEIAVTLDLIKHGDAATQIVDYYLSDNQKAKYEIYCAICREREEYGDDDLFPKKPDLQEDAKATSGCAFVLAAIVAVIVLGMVLTLIFTHAI